MNTSLDDLNAMRPKIEKVKDGEVLNINSPYKHYTQELTLSVNRFRDCKAILEAGGMDFTLVDELAMLTGACRELYSQMTMVTFPNSGSQKKWITTLEEAELVMHDIKETLYYALRNYPEALAKLSIISEGNSNADFIQDLNDYAVLARANIELLQEINYDLTNIEKCAEFSKILSDLYAQVTLDRTSSPEFTLFRDKAFTLAKRMVDELNLQARYIYRADRKKAATFMINAPQRKPSKRKTEKEETVTV